MAEVRECPLCGTIMRVKETQTVAQIPGNPKPTRTTAREWICPECDYFEEDDGDPK
jgi:hypothetical protein